MSHSLCHGGFDTKTHENTANNMARPRSKGKYLTLFSIQDANKKTEVEWTCSPCEDHHWNKHGKGA